MTVITRFAPSPTGLLHIGGARTALFNYLFAKGTDGKFLLRIEDTDKKRSTAENIDAITQGLKWIGLDFDDEITYQSKNLERHKQVVAELLEKDKAYKCYASVEELDALRSEAESKGEKFKYPNTWRDKTEADAPAGVDPVIRIKAPIEGEIKISDIVQGEISYPAGEIDDMIIMRADETPTYMLAAVVDDFDMNITHIIRGADHLTNSFRQKVIFDAMGWDLPKLAHIPLIHGSDGAKMSKRHGAAGIEDYKNQGYLPDALVNYLMNLGWSYGDEEKISMADAIEKFSLDDVGKSPSRFDVVKLNFINGLYMKELTKEDCFEQALSFVENKYNKLPDYKAKLEVLEKLSAEIQERSSNFVEYAQNAEFIFAPDEYTEKAQNMLEKGKEHIAGIIETFGKIDDWNLENIKASMKQYSDEKDVKFGKFMPAIRAAVCRTMEAPSLDLVLEAFGKDEVLNRLNNL